MTEITLENGRGAYVRLSTLGAAIAAIFVPDARGKIADVTVAAGGSAGKTIGRYANRIANGRFTLDDKTYVLAVNEGPNTLHGGPDGFSKREWHADMVAWIDHRTAAAAFDLQSPDGDQGFPGALDCRVTYSWNDDDELRIHYHATCEAPTVVNFTNHVYFNLRGEPGSECSAYELQIAGSQYTPLDEALIPMGTIAPVTGTSRDFQAVRSIGNERYDCNFVLNEWDNTLRYAATMRDPESGRVLVVETTEPGLQLYTGKPGAVALETQHFADAPNHPNFPSTVLRPGETFTSTTVYRFSVV
jgi:aldose 1-epimerase